MGGFDLSLPGVAALRPRASGGGGGASVIALAGVIAGTGAVNLAALTVGAEQAETTALVARMTVQPSTARRGLIDALIAGLKTDGVWAKLDWLALLAAHDAQAARLNWRAAGALSAVNSPGFMVDRGYAGDGASAYLDTGYNPATAGANATRNNTAIGVWDRTASDTSQAIMGTQSQAWFLMNRYSTTATTLGNVNDTGYTTLPIGSTGASGLTAASRTGAGALSLYRNGIGIGSGTAASGAPPNETVLLLRGADYSSHQAAAAFIGAALTAAEQASLFGRINSYLTAIGGA